MPPDWGHGKDIRINRNIPLICFYSSDGLNRGTFALWSVPQLNLNYGINEEGKDLIVTFSSAYSGDFFLYMDFRDKMFYETINSAAKWMASFYRFNKIPDSAYSVVYSTWYAMHQDVNEKIIEDEAKVAKKMGFEAIFLDDGWQTSDNNRGYWYTGDWEFNMEKFPHNMDHVKRIKSMGLKYVIWVALPFIGLKSSIYGRLEKKLLKKDNGMGAGIVDPNDEETRRYLRSKIKHLLELGFDGIKVDFIDSIADPENRDETYLGIPAFLEETLDPNDGKLIEFRQSYVSPSVLRYCTMVRAADCPDDPVENRVRILDLRLISPNVPVHSDPLMWNSDEDIKNIVYSLINVLFSVPQVSVMLKDQRNVVIETLGKWINFWKNNRDVLMKGEISITHPELLYGIVKAIHNGKCITVVYSPGTVKIENMENIIINATDKDFLIFSDHGVSYEVFDFNFQRIGSGILHEGLNAVEVPSCGMIKTRPRKT